MEGETLEGAYAIQQVARALPIWESEGLLGSTELPLMRFLGRVITEDAPAVIPFETLLEEVGATIN